MFERLLAKIAAALAKRKIPYMIIGGQAVLRYGEPRATKDIDITLGLGIEGVPAILRAIQAMGFRILAPDIEDFVRRTMVIPVQDEASGIRVDFILSNSSFERRALERAQDVRLGKTNVRFASLEDVVIHKIIAGRPRDIEDVESMLLKNPDFDKQYIRGWLKEFDRGLDGDFLAIFNRVLKNVEVSE